MHNSTVATVQARVLIARWWVRLTTASMILSVAMLVVGWMISMTLLVTSSRLLEAVFALP
ncbi:MAG: hypothetical protein ACRDFW_05465 [bacterium]